MQIKKYIKLLTSIAVFITAMLFSYPSLSQERDTLQQKRENIAAKDSLVKKDSLFRADSLPAKSARELKREERVKQRALRDSLRRTRPLILETYILPDSLKYKRLITWKHDSYLNGITMLNPDTTYNENFYDLPLFRKDVGFTYLGTAGSAAVTHNYFLRDENRFFGPAALYTPWSYTPETLPFYNVKTPVTELVYAGTLLASRQTEESNVRFLHTQNISPELNFNLLYKRYGSKGLLLNEATDDRTFAFSANFLGKKYLMHAGYLYQGVKRGENGGVTDDAMITDTTIDPRTINVMMSDAKNVYKRNTLFIDHSYGVTLIKSKDTTKKEGTIAYFGHSGEYTTYRRVYTDNVSASNAEAADFYNNVFNISESASYDSTRVSVLSNKVYLRLQPWASDAILSKIDGGVGYRLINVYGNRPAPESETETDAVANTNHTYSDLFAYAGASGKFREYFGWEGFGRFNLAGYFANDFLLEGKIRFSFYPVKEGIHLSAKLSVENFTQNWYDQYLYSNHYQWENQFGKTSRSRLEGNLEIPAFRLKLFAGYELTSNKLYYDTTGVVRQSGETISILSGYAQKDFKIGILHLNNRVLAQISSNDSIVPLPALSLNLRYFLEFDLVKSVLRGQFGADVTWNSAYYAPAYNPALSVFQLQTEKKIGKTPYIDLFANLQWKRASIFVKYENAFQGWPTSDYFSALHYIRPQTAIKFGIHWPFYVK
jgi:hypothetical protein